MHQMHQDRIAHACSHHHPPDRLGQQPAIAVADIPRWSTHQAGHCKGARCDHSVKCRACKWHAHC